MYVSKVLDTCCKTALLKGTNLPCCPLCLHFFNPLGFFVVKCLAPCTSSGVWGEIAGGELSFGVLPHARSFSKGFVGIMPFTSLYNF